MYGSRVGERVFSRLPLPWRPCLGGLIAGAFIALRPELAGNGYKPLNRLLVVGQRPLLQQLVRANRRKPDRPGMHVQPHRYRHRLDHGRRPPYVALPGHPRQPTTDA